MKVSSNTRRSRFGRHPKGQKAVGSRWRHPRRLRSSQRHENKNQGIAKGIGKTNVIPCKPVQMVDIQQRDSLLRNGQFSKRKMRKRLPALCRNLGDWNRSVQSWIASMIRLSVLPVKIRSSQFPIGTTPRQIQLLKQLTATRQPFQCRTVDIRPIRLNIMKSICIIVTSVPQKS